jgi:hypothetical protein
VSNFLPQKKHGKRKHLIFIEMDGVESAGEKSIII